MTLLTWLLGFLCAALGLAVYIQSRLAQRHSAALEETEMRTRAQIAAEKERILQLESGASRGQAEYNALLGACAEAVLVLDSSQTILRANAMARALFREPEKELTGRTLIQATLSAELSELVDAALRGAPTHGRELRLPGPGGQALIVSTASISSVSGASECLLVAQDVTELRRLENIRRDFVANVSHELRTPLASIRAMAETLQDGALEDPQVSDRFLDTIIRESDRLTRIAQDLLALSTAESGPPAADEVDLSALVSHVVEHIRPQAERADITISASVEPGLRVAGSVDQLQQVFVNLIDNAVTYTKAGGRVDVAAERVGRMVVTRVSDTGIGILSEHLGRIFERFYRVDKGRSRASGGTGLGLSIVKHIAESHGGSVAVESEYGRGSTFTVSLPAFEVAQPALEIDSESAPAFS